MNANQIGGKDGGGWVVQPNSGFATGMRLRRMRAKKECHPNLQDDKFCPLAIALAIGNTFPIYCAVLNFGDANKSFAGTNRLISADAEVQYNRIRWFAAERFNCLGFTDQADAFAEQVESGCAAHSIPPSSPHPYPQSLRKSSAHSRPRMKEFSPAPAWSVFSASTNLRLAECHDVAVGDYFFGRHAPSHAVGNLTLRPFL